MARHPRWVRRFMSEADLDRVARAVAEAEARTSAEIRVHLDARCPGDPMAQAVKVFERLGMHRTAERHGVLIYVAVGDRRLAVIGDTGIHERAGDSAAATGMGAGAEAARGAGAEAPALATAF